jgi:hypothetical protein
MGLSRCAILISDVNEDETVNLAKTLGLISSEPKCVNKDADQSEIAGSQVGVNIVGSWGVLFSEVDPFFQKDFTESFSKISKNKKIFTWLTESASGGLWFEFFNNGKLIRKWVEVEGEVAVNIGDALPEEPKEFFTEDEGNEERDEWSILALSEKITGVTEDIMFDGKYNIYQ